MEDKNLNTAKMIATLGVMGLLSGLALLFMGQTLIGASGSVVGAGLSLKGFKTIKDIKTDR